MLFLTIIAHKVNKFHFAQMKKPVGLVDFLTEDSKCLFFLFHIVKLTG